MVVAPITVEKENGVSLYFATVYEFESIGCAAQLVVVLVVGQSIDVWVDPEVCKLGSSCSGCGSGR